MKVLLASVVAALVAAPTLKVDTQEWTYGLASAGGSIWVGGLALGDVVRIDPESGKVTKRINVGARVFNLASAPGAVWAVANLSSTVSRIDAQTGRVTATVRVGNGPYDVEWGFGSAWVSNSSDGTVSRITGKKVVKTIKVGVEPNGLSAIGGYSLGDRPHRRQAAAHRPEHQQCHRLRGGRRRRLGDEGGGITLGVAGDESSWRVSTRRR